jgi:hypothetical protein
VLRRKGTVLLAATSVACALSTGSARGDGKAECFDSASRGQTLRDQHKLVDARAAFAVCARPVCPKQVSKDCTAWLDQVDQALPTVVVTVSDPAGRDLLDITVLLDGHPLATRVTGQSVPIDPGVHVFHFEAADGSRLDRSVLVREGVKNQAVAVVIGPAPSRGTTGAADGATGAIGAAGAATGGRDVTATSLGLDAPASGQVPWRTVGFVAGGVGIAGLGLGVAFGLKAMSDKNAAQCDATNACNPGPLGDARGAAAIATAGFIAGGVLLGSGAALVLFAPAGRETSPSSRGARLRLAPAIGPQDTGLQLAGSW